MAETITINSTPYTPALLTGYKRSSTSRSVLHPILQSTVPAVALRPAAAPSGTMRALFETETEAAAFEAAANSGHLATIASADRPTFDGTVAIGDVSLEVDPDTLTHLWVEFDWQKVS